MAKLSSRKFRHRSLPFDQIYWHVRTVTKSLYALSYNHILWLASLLMFLDKSQFDALAAIDIFFTFRRAVYHI